MRLRYGVSNWIYVSYHSSENGHPSVWVTVFVVLTKKEIFIRRVMVAELKVCPFCFKLGQASTIYFHRHVSIQKTRQRQKWIWLQMERYRKREDCTSSCARTVPHRSRTHTHFERARNPQKKTKRKLTAIRTAAALSFHNSQRSAPRP